MIAICGANGTIGKRVVAALKQRGAAIKALVRTPQPGGDRQVEFVAADLSRRADLVAAFAGVSTVFLLCPNGPRQEEMESNVVNATVASGVKRIVKLSVMGSGAQSPIEFARLHGRVEDAIRASGCEWTFVRPNMFMQNLFWYKSALGEGKLPLPLGEAAVSHVDGQDVGVAAAEALLDDRHSGKIYTVTGPKALTGAAAASVLSNVLERRIDYQPVSAPDFRTFLTSAGESDYVADAEVELFEHWSEGHGSTVTDDLETLTGSKATSFQEFVEREKGLFASADMMR